MVILQTCWRRTCWRSKSPDRSQIVNAVKAASMFAVQHEALSKRAHVLVDLGRPTLQVLLQHIHCRTVLPQKRLHLQSAAPISANSAWTGLAFHKEATKKLQNWVAESISLNSLHTSFSRWNSLYLDQAWSYTVPSPVARQGLGCKYCRTRDQISADSAGIGG